MISLTQTNSTSHHFVYKFQQYCFHVSVYLQLKQPYLSLSVIYDEIKAVNVFSVPHTSVILSLIITHF